MRRRFLSWRLLWLIPAALLYAETLRQAAAHRALLAQIAKSGLPAASIPSTVYIEYPGRALVSACLGTIFVLFAFRPDRPDAA